MQYRCANCCATFLCSQDIEIDDNLVVQQLLNNIYLHYDAPSIQSYQLEITLLHSICVAKSRYDEHRLGCHWYGRLLRVGQFLFKLLSTSKHFSDTRSVLALWSSGFKRKRKRFANINVEKSLQCWELLTKKCNSFLFDPVWYCLALCDRMSLPFVTPLPNQIKPQSVYICQCCYQTVQLK